MTAKHQNYTVIKWASNPDPATYCPTNGYIDPTQPNDDFLIIPITKPKYGLLYNWYAATDSRNIAASGWHVPSNTEMQTMQTYLGGQSLSGGKLKETGTTYWDSPNSGATNEVKFNGRGAGQRQSEGGSFSALKTSTWYWSNYKDVLGKPYAFTLNKGNADMLILQFQSYQLAVGLSVRLVKDVTTLTNGQTGTYTGNDGKVYRTICIGTQEWIADNLAETKYRDGSTIPVVTDNSAWAALTTGALCAYNNDWNNV